MCKTFFNEEIITECTFNFIGHAMFLLTFCAGDWHLLSVYRGSDYTANYKSYDCRVVLLPGMCLFKQITHFKSIQSLITKDF